MLQNGVGCRTSRRKRPVAVSTPASVLAAMALGLAVHPSGFATGRSSPPAEARARASARRCGSARQSRRRAPPTPARLWSARPATGAPAHRPPRRTRRPRPGTQSRLRGRQAVYDHDDWTWHTPALGFITATRRKLSRRLAEG